MAWIPFAIGAGAMIHKLMESDDEDDSNAEYFRQQLEEERKERLRREERECLERKQNEAQKEELRIKNEKERKENEAKLEEQRKKQEEELRAAAEKAEQQRIQNEAKLEELRMKIDNGRKNNEQLRLHVLQMRSSFKDALHMIRDVDAAEQGPKSFDRNVDVNIRHVPDIIQKMIDDFLDATFPNPEEYQSGVQFTIKLVMGQASELRSEVRRAIRELERMERENVVDRNLSEEVKGTLNLVLERNALFMNALNVPFDAINLENIQRCLQGLIQAATAILPLANPHSTGQFIQGLLQGNIGQNLAIATDGEGILSIEEQ